MVPTTEQARARVVEHLISRNGTDLRGRIQRAHQLVQAGAVRWNADLGVHVVKSGSTAGVSYQVSLATKRCACPDSADQRAPHGWCKHLLAVAIMGMADVWESRQAFEQPRSAAARTWRQLVTEHQARQRQLAAARAAVIAEVA